MGHFFFVGLHHADLFIFVLGIIINTPILTHRLYFVSCTSQLSIVVFIVAWLCMRLCCLLCQKFNWDCLEWYCYRGSLFPVITPAERICNVQAVFTFLIMLRVPWWI